MQSEYSKGAADMRDNVIAHIIGMQNELENNIKDKRYQELQKLLELIEERYGKMFCKFTG